MKRKYIIGISLLGISFIHLVSWNIFLVLSHNYIKTQYIPDDGFYYLTLAKNFIKYSHWTFDSGLTVTTGFNLLYAYFLVGILKIMGQLNAINKALISSFFFIIPVYYFIWLLFKKYKNENILFISALLLTSINVFYNTISITEWTMVVLLSFLYIIMSLQLISKKLMQNKWLFLIIALLGTLSRIEFIVLSIIFCFLWYIIIYRKGNNQNIIHFKNLLYGVIGSCMGIIIIFLHNFFFSNQLLQSSAMVKYFWSSKVGHNPVLFLYQCSKIFLSVPRLRINWNIRHDVFQTVMYLVIILCIAILVYSSRKKVITTISGYSTQTRFIIISNIAVVIAYTFIYSFNSMGIQTWYTGLVLCSLGLLTFYLSHNAFKKYQLMYYIIILITIVNIFVCWRSNPFYSGQQTGIIKGQYVKTELSGKIVAAWDSGIIGYYSGGKVINLDGLVNDEVINYIKGDSLVNYLSAKKIYCLLQHPPKDTPINYGITNNIDTYLKKKKIFFKGKTFNLYLVK
jgi:hypothetical protein